MLKLTQFVVILTIYAVSLSNAKSECMEKLQEGVDTGAMFRQKG